MFAIEDLMSLHPEQLFLKISDERRENAWQKSRSFSHPLSQWNAYLNQLVVDTAIPGLQRELDLNPTLWKPHSLDSILEIVSGTKLLLENHSLVMIPSETLDTEEFRVPQEWVDIPSWTANYYLVVQIEPEDGYLHLWGYTTHEQLKSRGIYNEFDRTYVMNQSDMIDDLDVMMVAQELCDAEIAFVPSLPSLSAMQAEHILEQLSLQTIENPRLAIPFSLWGAFIENDGLREQLYQRRCHPVVTQIQQKFVHLSQWINNSLGNLEWQDFRGLSITNTNQMAFRSDSNHFQTELDPEIVRESVDIINGNYGEETWKTAAQNLRDATPGDSQSIEALVNLLSKTTDEETLWEAAETLRILEPQNPAGGVWKSKNLGAIIPGESVILMVAILPQPEEQLAVLLRLYPNHQQGFLPQGIELSILDETGELLETVEAENADNDNIQISLAGNHGERFSVEVKLDENRITEAFMI